MIAAKWLTLSIGVVIIIGLGAYSTVVFQNPGPQGHETSSTSTTSTTRTTCTLRTSSGTWTTQTTSRGTSSSSTATVTQGSFSYTPSTPVKIDSVEATTYNGQNGQTLVSFAVAFQNIGSTTIYTVSGCGSGLTSEVAQGSSVLQKVTGGPLCLCAEFLAPISPGSNHTSYTPGCWSGYHYILAHAGTVEVNFTLTWGTSGQNFQQGNATNITANFTFS